VQQPGAADIVHAVTVAFDNVAQPGDIVDGERPPGQISAAVGQRPEQRVGPARVEGRRERAPRLTGHVVHLAGDGTELAEEARPELAVIIRELARGRNSGKKALHQVVTSDDLMGEVSPEHSRDQ
jgi:hypothetical protein